MKEKSDLLTAGRLQLKNLEDRDKDSFLQMVTDDRIKKTYMLPDFIDQTAADAFFRRMKALCEEDTHFVYGIYLDGRLIGMINACGKQGTTIELGYFISADHWNQGFATEALGTAIRELFRMGYTGITAGYFEGNHASRRVMEKCGMRPLKTETEVVYRGVSRRCLYLGTETAGQEEPGRDGTGSPDGSGRSMQ